MDLCSSPCPSWLWMQCDELLCSWILDSLGTVAHTLELWATVHRSSLDCCCGVFMTTTGIVTKKGATEKWGLWWGKLEHVAHRALWEEGGRVRSLGQEKPFEYCRRNVMGHYAGSLGDRNDKRSMDGEVMWLQRRTRSQSLTWGRSCGLLPEIWLHCAYILRTWVKQNLKGVGSFTWQRKISRQDSSQAGAGKAVKISTEEKAVLHCLIGKALKAESYRKMEKLMSTLWTYKPSQRMKASAEWALVSQSQRTEAGTVVFLRSRLCLQLAVFGIVFHLVWDLKSMRDTRLRDFEFLLHSLFKRAVEARPRVEKSESPRCEAVKVKSQS